MFEIKIAIIGAGICGLSCALECERLGIPADIYERDDSVGWPWPSVTFWPKVLLNKFGDPRDYVKKNYNLDFTPIAETKNVIMKSPNQSITISGELGYLMARGKADESLENQFHRQINKTPITFNTQMNYEEASKKYDYVVIATGSDTEARKMGLWEDEGNVLIFGGRALGSFDSRTLTIFFNTEYAGSGYAIITPFNQSSAAITIYAIGKNEFSAIELFDKFLKIEKLDHLQLVYRLMPPLFTTGHVKQFRTGNILLAGRAAGLTERLLGVGALYALISGTLAARALIQGVNYESEMKDLQSYIESISSFRKIFEGFDNSDFDKLVSFLGTPGIKQLLYNTPIDFSGLVGGILKHLVKP